MIRWWGGALAVCAVAGTALAQDAYHTEVAAPAAPHQVADEGRAVTEVTRTQMDERLPRSAPDAVRYEPGVFVQQTAHAQGSAYIRGMTGQQTLLLFDGIRLNNSTYRQGPNQYFFTLDSTTINRIVVVRGGASTRWGSDALGGVLAATPLVPPWGQGPGFAHHPRVRLQGATADRTAGFRVQSTGAWNTTQAWMVGVGARHVGLLRSGGPIRGLDGGEALVPRFAPDGRTQLGTGFDEVTADAVWRARSARWGRWKLAAYTYRQFDAPRTDQCPAAFAPYNECLEYEEQFRDLVYGVWEDAFAASLAAALRVTVSWQRQHERYALDRPTAWIRDTGIDDVHTLGLTARGRTASWPVGPGRMRWGYGVDTYWDLVRSRAWTAFTDIDVVVARSRGKYLDGARYVYGGAWLDGRYALTPVPVLFTAGGRWSWIGAQAPADPESGSQAVDASWFPWVGHVGAVVGREQDGGALHLNVDRSFRAPNLDDLTSRQQTGPGFQFENAHLAPEYTTSVEAGLVWEGPLSAQVWGFYTWLHDAIMRSPRDASACPPQTSQCAASWNRFQLINADQTARLRGLEGIVLLRLPAGVRFRATAAWTVGDGPYTGDPPAGMRREDMPRVPLSRVPPVNGTVELWWRGDRGIATGVAVRWAAPQRRLALTDVSDERIPPGGTPGFAVCDVRVAYRPSPRVLAALQLENVFDTAYRYHGSSVNGPGRGVLFTVEVGPVWRK